MTGQISKMGKGMGVGGAAIEAGMSEEDVRMYERDIREVEEAMPERKDIVGRMREMIRDNGRYRDMVAYSSRMHDNELLFAQIVQLERDSFRWMSYSHIDEKIHKLHLMVDRCKSRFYIVLSYVYNDDHLFRNTYDSIYKCVDGLMSNYEDSHEETGRNVNVKFSAVNNTSNKSQNPTHEAKEEIPDDKKKFQNVAENISTKKNEIDEVDDELDDFLDINPWSSSQNNKKQDVSAETLNDDLNKMVQEGIGIDRIAEDTNMNQDLPNRDNGNNQTPPKSNLINIQQKKLKPKK